MDWYRIKFLPDNKFVKFAAIWLFILPYAANLKLFKLFKINPPFAWYFFFFAALSFTIANIIYLFFCPRIVQDHISFSGFLGDRKTNLHLLEYQKQIKDTKTLSSKDTNDENSLKNNFWEIHQKAKNCNNFAKYTCISLYFLGFLLVFIGIGYQVGIVIISFI